jgi:hypothetical protein
MYVTFIVYVVSLRYLIDGELSFLSREYCMYNTVSSSLFIFFLNLNCTYE